MKTSLLVLSLAAGALVVACNRSDPSSTTDASGGAKPTVALVVKTLNNPFFIEMQQGAQQAADRLGVNLVVQAADREVDVERQMQIIENLIERKVSVLCIAPSGSREIVPVVVKANKAGIPVLIVDTRVDEKALAAAGGKTATFIGSDNFDGGKLAGAFIVEKLGGQGKVAVLEFLLNGLRLLDGVCTDIFEQRAGQPLEELHAARTEAVARSWLADEPGKLRATPLGLERLNRLLELFA